LCVDDHPSFRAVLRTLVASIPGFVQVGEAASGEDAMAAVEAVRTDLVVMDLRMPGIGGFEAAATMVERHPKLVVVLVSANQVEPPLPLAHLGPNVTFVPKGDLSPKGLLDLWNQRRTLSEL
jgi:DNA-binding NarL/FixJ family response regulator